MADADSLADAIMELRENESLRERIAEKGYATFTEKGNADAVARELKKVIDGLI
jgi:glycosyltransferase involved in cell wall biosynthesis